MLQADSQHRATKPLLVRLWWWALEQPQHITQFIWRDHSSGCAFTPGSVWLAWMTYARVIQAYQLSREAILLQRTAEGMWDAAGDRHDDSKIYQPDEYMVSNVFQLQDETQTQWQSFSKPAGKGTCLLSAKWHPDLQIHHRLHLTPSKAFPTLGTRSCNKVLCAIRHKKTSILQNFWGRKAGLTLSCYVLDGW